MSHENLPEFDRPPLIETVWSVQFSPLRQLIVPHFGLFWQRIRATYPTCQVQPPLPQELEQFDTPKSLSVELSLALRQGPPVRCWFLSTDGTRVLQIQEDRFIYNWRKTATQEHYPRYGLIRDTFTQEWKSFCQFLADEQLETPQPNQCEIVYINHIEPVDDHGRRLNLGEIFPAWAGTTSGPFLPPPSHVESRVVYNIPDHRGRLYIDFKPAVRHSDGKIILVLSLTARGAPGGAEIADVLAWFDLGREWVVRGFADFTSSTMHQHWGRR